MADGHTPHGLLMPKVAGCKDIHKLYSPKSRKTEFPTADFRFLLSVTANVARAFAVVHQNHCVIGDVNHGSITVAQNATVKLIDCDSFQVVINGQNYLCEVGVPTFTPPELQGRPFHGIVRTTNHDNFGLAVLIFHLLFMGRHPFAGRYLGRGDMPIETAIQQFRFAYGTDRKLVLMEPPPHVPALSCMSSSIAALFERAFSRQATNGHPRPPPSDWIMALDATGKQLARCKREPNHFYVSASPSCPWCSVESATGVVLFNEFVDGKREVLRSFRCHQQTRPVNRDASGKRAHLISDHISEIRYLRLCLLVVQHGVCLRKGMESSENGRLSLLDRSLASKASRDYGLHDRE